MFQKEVLEVAGQCAAGYYYCGGSCQSIPCYMTEGWAYAFLLGGAAAVVGAAAWSAYQASRGRTNLPNVVRGWLAVAVSVFVGIIFAVLGNVAVKLTLGRPNWVLELVVVIVIGMAVSYLALGTAVKKLGVSDGTP